MKTLGVSTGTALVGFSGLSAGAETYNPYSDLDLTSVETFTDAPLENYALDIAQNPAESVAVFLAFTQEDGMELYFATGVESETDTPDSVKALTGTSFVYAPQWVDDRTLRYWAGDAVYERTLRGQTLSSPETLDSLHLRDLVGDDLSTDGFGFSDCQTIKELDTRVCVSSDLFGENLRRDCYCGPCSGGETPRLASAALEIDIFESGSLSYSLGGWVGFNFRGLNACYWSGQEDTNVCAYACAGLSGIPAPADIASAFGPLLEPAGIDPQSEVGLVAAALIIAAIVAFPGPTPV